MSHANDQEWPRLPRGQRNAKGASTEAEFFLSAGKILVRRLHQGYPLAAVARALGISLEEAYQAVRFADSPPWFVLRALVEDWPWPRIKDSIDESLGVLGPERHPN